MLSNNQKGTELTPAALAQAYGDLLEANKEPRVTCTRLETMEEVLQQADVRCPGVIPC